MSERESGETGGWAKAFRKVSDKMGKLGEAIDAAAAGDSARVCDSDQDRSSRSEPTEPAELKPTDGREGE